MTMTTKNESVIAIDKEAGHNNGIEDLSEKDEAMAMVGEHEHDLDPVLVARTIRKIDLCLLPVMMFGCIYPLAPRSNGKTPNLRPVGLCYYDKAILGSAALFGMTTDLQLTVIVDHTVTPPIVDTTRLSWATSIFYFGMLVGLYPLTFALQRFNMGRLLGVIVLIWSAICMATAGVTTHQGLYIQRFFLGFFEGIVPTSFMCIVSSYYTQEEQALRQSFWFSATCLFSIIGGGLNYGFSTISGGGLKSWQYIYLLAGVLTIAFGLVCFATPNSPVTAWFLSDEERFAAVERLRRNQGGVRCPKIKMSQIRESVLRDPKTYLVFIIITAAYTINGAITGFGPLIVSTFNYTPLEAILLQFPLGAVGFTAMLVTGYLGTRYSNIRLIIVMICCLPVIAGCVMIWKSEWSYHAVMPVVGYTITGFWTVVVTLTISAGMSNVAGHTKKSFMAATIFVAYCVGNIVGPLMVRSQSRGEHYPELWLGLIIWYVQCLCENGVLWRLIANEEVGYA